VPDKHDGFRILAKRNPRRRAPLYPGYDLAVRFTLAATAVPALPARSCLVDGEATACNQNGLAVFEMNHWRCLDGDIVLCAFDLLELNGQDLCKAPIAERKRTLPKLLHRSPPVSLSMNTMMATVRPFSGMLVSSAVKELCRNGLVHPSCSGRVDEWLKIKNPSAPTAKREADRGR
jgi:bifunctional non-homologous end joining protein LigD